MVKSLFFALLIFTSYLSRQPHRWFSRGLRTGSSVTQRETRFRLQILFIRVGKVLDGL